MWNTVGTFFISIRPCPELVGNHMRAGLGTLISNYIWGHISWEVTPACPGAFPKTLKIVRFQYVEQEQTRSKPVPAHRWHPWLCFCMNSNEVIRNRLLNRSFWPCISALSLCIAVDCRTKDSRELFELCTEVVSSTFPVNSTFSAGDGLMDVRWGCAQDWGNPTVPALHSLKAHSENDHGFLHGWVWQKRKTEFGRKFSPSAEFFICPFFGSLLVFWSRLVQ